MKRKIFFITAGIVLYAQAVFAGVYTIDIDHSHIGFSVRHLVISNVKGEFTQYKGTFELDENDNLKAGELVIDAASMNTRNEKRDKHLRSADFLELEKFPTITFTLKKTLSRAENSYELLGDFTIHGVTKEIVLRGEMLGKVKDPWGNNRVRLYRDHNNRPRGLRACME